MHARPTRFLVAAVLALASCGGRPEEEVSNLLLITIDTLRADHLGHYGYPRPTSTHLDRLASEGVVLDAAYASSSWTLPSLCTIMTSQYMSTHDCSRNDSSLSDTFQTLAERLDEAGFRTSAVVNHIFLDPKYGLDQGFDDYDDELIAETFSDSHAAVTSPSVTERGLRQIELRAERPQDRWFLWLHYFDPHELYRVHPQTDAFGLEHDVDRYDGEIAFTDECIGRVLTRLDQLGLRDDTLVVVVADHGEEFGDHGGRGHRFTLYNEVLRVPWIVRAPGLSPRRVGRVVRTIDLLPTVLELLDLAAPEMTEGRSVLPLLRGEHLAPRAAFGELADGARRWDTLVDGRWKLYRDARGSMVQLFDLRSDPWEKNDVSRDHPDVLATLKEKIDVTARKARLKSKLFGPPGEIELSEADQKRLKQLGYGGDH